MSACKKLSCCFSKWLYNFHPHLQCMINAAILDHHRYLVLSNFLSNCHHSNGCVTGSHCDFNLHLLKTNYVEYLFMYLFVIHTLFFGQELFQNLLPPPLLNHVGFFLSHYSVVRVLYAFWMKVLYKITWFACIFSQILNCPSSFIVFLEEYKLLILMSPILIF